MGSLTLRFEPVDERYGELVATVDSDGFAGVGSAWLSHSEVLEFTDRLSEYPLGSSPPPSISGGLGHKTQQPQTDLSLILTPDDPLGGISVLVELTGPSSSANGRIPYSKVQTGFVVSYMDVERFQRSLRRLIRGGLGEAVLTRQTATLDTF